MGLKKWSQAVIGGIIVGGSLAAADREASAWSRRKRYRVTSDLGDPWANGGRKWSNRGGAWANAGWADGTARRWANGTRAWANRPWTNGTSRWANDGKTWVNGY